jgi:hypothetical protein
MHVNITQADAGNSRHTGVIGEYGNHRTVRPAKFDRTLRLVVCHAKPFLAGKSVHSMTCHAALTFYSRYTPGM